VRQSLMQLADAADTRVQLQLAATNRLHSDFDYSVQKPAVDTNGKRFVREDYQNNRFNHVCILFVYLF